ncbi:MAG: hypothetical protein HUJ16_14210 [Kangiella sp.]|nr:hypothetical protein [Kangiella sp.]
MKILPLALAATAFAVLATGCNSTSSRYAVSSDDDEYVYVVDWEKVYLVEKIARDGNANVDTVWINYPRKRVKKSELASN